MRTFKIVIGFIFLFGAGKEYINASRELGSFFEITIIIPVLLFLFLCTWLIGSGFSSRKLKFKSFEFLKFFIVSFVTFAFFAFFSLSSKVPPSHFVEINGLTVPLGKCIARNRGIIPDKKEGEKYCKCFIEKVLNDADLKSKYGRRLENDDFIKVIKEIQNSQIYFELGIENCMKSIKIEWSDNLANSMEENWKKQLIGTEFEQSNNIDEYCACLIKEYRKYPVSKILEGGFAESNEAMEIDEMCAKQSEKK